MYIKIQDLEFIQLEELRIEQILNDHSYMYLKVLIEDKHIDAYSSLSEKEIEVFLMDEVDLEKCESLFFGLVSEITIGKGKRDNHLELKAVSSSYKLNDKKITMVFQDKETSYGDVIKKISKSNNHEITIMDREISHRKIEKLLIQYEESNWEFLKRICSMLNQAIVNSGCYTWIGDLERQAHEIKGDPSYFITVQKGIKTYKLELMEKYEVGDALSLKGKRLIIVESTYIFESGCMHYYYKLKEPAHKSLVKVENENIKGASIKAEVVETEGDKERLGRVQVKFYCEENIQNRKWFKYLSPYAGKDGGFYFMPEKGEVVNVYFPSCDEDEAFVTGVLRQESNEAFETTKTKILGNNFGKALIMNEKEIIISGLLDKNFIKVSEKDIQVKMNEKIINIKDESIEMVSGNSKIIMNDNEIVLKTNGSSITLDKEIKLKGSKIHLN